MADKILDEYEPVGFYAKHTKPKESGFAKFQVDKKYYFCRYIDGEIAMLSQAYQAASGRDNGVESVKKNSKLAKRYVFDTRKGGKHGFSLRAGNSQEIAISPNYDTREEAEHVAGRMRGSIKTKAAAAPKPKPKPKAKAKVAATKRKNNEDNYKPLAFYKRQTKGRKEGIETFKGDDGLYYFAYFENDKIELISEGYPTTSARDTGVASVEKNIKIEKRYQFRGPLKNGKYDYKLKAGNGKEIARSVWYGSAAAAATGAAYLMGTRKRVPSVAPIAGAAALAATPTLAKAAEPVDKADDYLACEAYEGHPVNDRINNVAMFKHENGQFYFALYDEDGNVRLRSEGFLTANARDQELSGVLRLKDNPDYYKRIERGSRYIDVLYDETGREVGRSCLCEAKPAVSTAAVAAGAGVAAMAATSAAASEPEPVAEPPVIETPEAAAYVDGEGGGIWGWLKWLLLALLALLALFFLFKSCTGPKTAVVTPPPVPTLVACWDGSEAENEASCPAKITCWDNSFAVSEAACPVQTFTCWDGSSVTDLTTCPVEPVVETPAIEPEVIEPEVIEPEIVEPEVRVETPTIATSAIGLGGLTLFSAGDAIATSVDRLGTNPQFGDSHALTPSGFYDKLNNRAVLSGYDRGFLNYVAREMGYADFDAIPVSAFSNATLAQGTRGILGYGMQHAYQYSELNMIDTRDLEAFKIDSLNGKDVYFMKTCGNYMFITG